jgi:putative thiamine transport system permease protein
VADSAGDAARRHATRIAPVIAVALLLIPVLVGIFGALMPAFGYAPMLGAHHFSLDAWHALLEQPGLTRSALISLQTGLSATFISLLLVFGFLAAADGTRALSWIRRLVSPLLALPHAAAAFGIAFLIAPSGWLARLLSPWATGWQQPPDWLIVQDASGYAMIAGLVVKEVPFLLLMALTQLPQTDARRRLMLARALGYSAFMAWLKVIGPSLYALLRLPIYAVIAYASATVDVAMILGPSNPPTLAVSVLRWFNHPDLSMRAMASAGALLQGLVTLAALATWRSGEWLLVRLLRPSLVDGRRRLADAWLAPFFRIAMLFSATLVILGITSLALHSVAGSWRFPDAFPATLSGTQWTRAWPNISEPLWSSVGIAAGATLISLIVAIAALQNEVRRKSVASALAMRLLYLPLIVPQTAFLFGLATVVESMGIRPGVVPVLFAHCVFVLPFVYLSLADPYRNLDQRWQMIAHSLGASSVRTFWCVRLPMLLTPILTAAALGMALSVGLYLPTLLFGAGQVNTLTTEALALAASGDRRVIGVWALLQTLVPMIGFGLALALPRLVWRNRRDLREGH